VSDTAAFCVSSAGDVNGDGYGDLVVGAPTGDDGGGDAGEAYVVLGRASGFSTVADDGRRVIDLTSLGAADGFVIQGDAAGDNAGYSVSSAGDVNGDGYGDLVVGARSGDDGGSNAGVAYVVLGRHSGFGALVDGRAVLDLGTLSAADGFVVQGDAADDRTGWSVSSAGDVNGDGFDDLIVGAPGGDDGASGAGEAYVLLGGAFGGTATRPIEMTGSVSAEILIGGAGDDRLTGGGGFDLIRGGAGNDTIEVADAGFRGVDGGGGTDTLVLGGSGLTLDLTDRTVAARIAGIERIDLGGPGGSVLNVVRPAVLAGGAVAGGMHVVTVEGDVGDGVWLRDSPWRWLGTVVDGTISFDRYVSGNAEARIEQGVNVRQAYSLPSLAPSAGFAVLGAAPGDRAGASVSSAGDVNGDGYLDLIVGAPGDAGRGAAYVIFGRSSGFGSEVDGQSVIDLAALAPDDGFAIQGEAGENAGISVSSAGDVNGDGYADLIVGAADGGCLEEGVAYLLFGRPSGFGTPAGGSAVIDLESLSPAHGFIIHGVRQFDRFGASVSSAGDVNGDGFADLLVGAPNGGPSVNPDLYGLSGDTGDAVVVFGGSAFPTSIFEGRAVLSLPDRARRGASLSRAIRRMALPAAAFRRPAT